MSYRDLRNFTEMLRALGFPQFVSMESFRSPNFPLVAEIIKWLSHRLDPETDVPNEYDDEDQRVALIRIAAQNMALKANIKLNTKRLYQADGFAVKELLKITAILFEALQSNYQNEDRPESSSVTLKDFDVSHKIGDMKLSRQLASEITTNGANLYDLLGKEAELRTLRHNSVARQYEITDVETAVRKAIEDIRKEISDNRQLIENVASTEMNLDAKIEKRKIELDRYEKRLQALKKVRPAFLEEFSVLEEELKGLYEQYVVKYRCLTYLEQKAVEVERVESERMNQQMMATRKLVEKIRAEEQDNPTQQEIDSFRESEEEKKIERPRARTGGRPAAAKTPSSRNPYDQHAAERRALLLSESSGSSSETDTDLLLDGDEPELAGVLADSDVDDDDEDASLSIRVETPPKRVPPSGRRTTQGRMTAKQPENSDDDF